MITIDFLYTVLGTPLGYIMWVCYLLVNNFGLAIIIFTFIVKAAMFPLNLKQQKNMAASQLFQPKVQEIQRKYKNDKQKQQEELAKLQQQGYNPMGGCGPMLLTFILLFGVIDVVYKPMTHMEHLDWGNEGAINTVVSTAKTAEYASIVLTSPNDTQAVLEFLADNTTITLNEDKSNQISSANADGTALDVEVEKTKVQLTPADLKTYALTDEQVTILAGGSSRLSNEVKNALTKAKTNYSSNLYKELNALRTYTYHTDAFSEMVVSQEVRDKLDNLVQNMEFCGINLGETPSLAHVDATIAVPIIAFILSLLQMFISQWIQKKTNPMAAQMGGGAKILLYIMPLFSLYISFIVPAGVGFYWGISYIFGIAQSLITYKFWPVEKLKEEAQKKLDEKSAKFTTTATVVDVDDNGNKSERQEKLANLSQKELKEYYRKKLEEARKADAEKYGEEYKEDDGDDK